MEKKNEGSKNLELFIAFIISICIFNFYFNLKSQYIEWNVLMKQISHNA